MKKTVFIVGLLIAFLSTTFAQEQEQEKVSFKPEKGNFTLEVGFNPFPGGGNGPIVGFGLKGRYLLNDRLYLRLNIPLSGSARIYDSNVVGAESKRTDRSVSYGFIPGIEYHVGNMKKLSPYFGGEIGFRHNIFSYTEKSDDGVYVLKGKNISGTGNRSSIALTFSALAGIDWYITQHLYLGAEFGFGLDANFAIKGKEIIQVSGIETTIDHKEKSTTINFSFAPVSLIRLGWAF